MEAVLSSTSMYKTLYACLHVYWQESDDVNPINYECAGSGLLSSMTNTVCRKKITEKQMKVNRRDCSFIIKGGSLFNGRYAKEKPVCVLSIPD